MEGLKVYVGAWLALILLFIVLLTGQRIIASFKGEPIPVCAEDEYIARRPYPDGMLYCIHIDLIMKGE